MLAELRIRLGSELEGLAHRLTTGMETEMQRDLQQQIRRLNQLVAGLVCVDPNTIWHDRAGYGSVVRVRDRATGAEETYTLMTGDLIDLEEGQVSLASPIGNALLGRRRGERVVVETPRGKRQYQILDVATLPAKLGIKQNQEEATGAAANQTIAPAVLLSA